MITGDHNNFVYSLPDDPFELLKALAVDFERI